MRPGKGRKKREREREPLKEGRKMLKKQVKERKTNEREIAAKEFWMKEEGGGGEE